MGLVRSRLPIDPINEYGACTPLRFGCGIRKREREHREAVMAESEVAAGVGGQLGAPRHPGTPVDVPVRRSIQGQAQGAAWVPRSTRSKFRHFRGAPEVWNRYKSRFDLHIRLVASRFLGLEIFFSLSFFVSSIRLDI